ncbi:MAG: type II secretion system secretin GspD [Pikeienuella sp.]
MIPTIEAPLPDLPIRFARLRRRAPLFGLLLAGALAGCADNPHGDPFAALRAEAEQPETPLRETRGAGAMSGGGGAAAPVRGFVRRSYGDPSVWRASAEGDPADYRRDEEFTLNFETADLSEVVRAMLGEGLGANYVIDPAVSGAVTMRTNRPLTREQILPVLEEILRMNDAAIVGGEGGYSIVPRDAVGLTAPVISARDARAQGLGVRVTPLRFVDVAAVRGVLEGFRPVAGSIAYDESRNLIFTIGTGAEQQTIADLVAMLDADAFAGRTLAMQPLRHAAATEVAEELSAIYPPGGADPRIRFLPLERLNAVLIISRSMGLTQEAISIARSFDQIGAETPQIYVYEVENRRASELARMVGDLLGVEVAASAARDSGALGPSLTEESVGETDGAAAAADPVAEAPRRGGGGGGLQEGAEGVIRIGADETSNAIVALATASGANRVRAALRQLDRQALQVMLQATLAEVVLNDQLEFGVRWFFESGNWGGSFSDLGAGAVGSVFPGFNAVFKTSDVRIALNALDEVTDVRLLSTPTLMVMDNETARLQVGDQVPITTRRAVSVDNATAPIVSETTYRDTGVILALRPRVNQNGLVTLDIRQEVSNVSSDRSGTDPTFSQRLVESTVAVDSGDTIAIGGLIRQSEGRSRDGIPGLSRLPLVGAMFGGSSFSGARTELIVLITPQVIRDQRSARQATAEMRDKLGGIFGPPTRSFPLTGAQRGSLADAPAGLGGH